MRDCMQLWLNLLSSIKFGLKLLSLNLIFVAVAHHEGRNLRWYVKIDLF